MSRERMFDIFTHMPQITTERLLLRKIVIQDAEDMFSYAKLSEVTRYLTWYEHPDLLYTKRYITFLQRKYHAGEFYDFAVVHRADRKMIGTCGFTRIDTVNNAAEIGYVLSPAYHHMGIATEAAGAVMKFGFETLSLHRIEAKFMEGNDASRAVMERLGMTFEGFERDAVFVKGRYVTVGKCARLATDK